MQEAGEGGNAVVIAPDSLNPLAPPPRAVPTSLTIVNALNWTTMIGWLLFAFGAIFLARGTAAYAVFAVIGLGMIAGGLLIGRRRNGLLRDGLLAMGRLTASRPTDVNLEDPDYELTFETTASGGRSTETKVRTNDIYLIARVSEGLVPLLRDPGDPSRVHVLDAQPGRPRLDEHGQLRGRTFAAVARLSLVFVILAIALYTAERLRIR